MTEEVYGGEQLLRSWGGKGSAEFDENVRLLNEINDGLSPELKALAQSTITTPDGREVQLGNYGPVIEQFLSMAKQGKSMSNVDLSSLNPASRTSSGKGGNTQSQMNSLTAAIHAAQMKGDRAEMKRLDAQRQALARRAYGNKPAVGNGGRYV